jgi:hypothetical protein
MSEVCTAVNPLHADLINAGIDYGCADIQWSIERTLVVEPCFSPIALVLIALDSGKMQYGKATDRAKTYSHCAANAQNPVSSAGFRRTGCGGRRLRASDGRLKQSQRSLRMARIADGLVKNSVSRFAASPTCGCVELLFHPHSDVHTRGLRLCNR